MATHRRGSWYRYPMPNPITQELLNSQYFKACEIKIPFKSKKAAEDKITNAGLSKSGYRRGTAYKCDYCRYWHITSNRPKPQKGKTTDGDN